MAGVRNPVLHRPTAEPLSRLAQPILEPHAWLVAQPLRRRPHIGEAAADVLHAHPSDHLGLAAGFFGIGIMAMSSSRLYAWPAKAALALVIVAAIFDLRSHREPAKKLRSRGGNACATA